MTQRILDLALELGFDAAAAAPAEPYPGAETYQAWVEKGMHGEMAYLAKDPERRSDPRKVLPEARSVLSLVHNYYPGALPGMPTDVPRGIIARYALGDDYHDVIIEKLRVLAEALGDPLARAYVDTGPILERSVAERSGLGWIGKNGCLIRQGTGSYTFLSEIVTAQELPVAEAHPDRCGSCTRCVSVCPTGAIVSPGTVDSRRCISYLTIEHRGPVPLELRSKLGLWVFGCDLCQEVCPWNRKATPAIEPAFAPKAERLYPRLTDLLLISQEDFSRVFRRSAIKRTKRRGLARNAAYALGNAADPDTIPALAEALTNDSEAVVRGAAAWALGRIGGAKAQQSLELAYSRETDEEVQTEIRASLLSAR